MAVYTVLSDDDFAAVARAFDLGEILGATFVPQGSINTNVRLQTARGAFFLRHTTVRSSEDLEFEAALLEHLAESRFPAPAMLRTPGGAPDFAVHGGRACVFRVLAGEELTFEQLTELHCERLGAELGKLHRATNAFDRERQNPYGATIIGGWLERLSGAADPQIPPIAAELSGLLSTARALERGLLPRGVIHADLFMDNVKWVGDRVGAFFDFEMACRDAYVLDVAIALNAWCFKGGYRAPLCRSFVAGYQSVRSFSALERESLYAEALFGAVRYTASRIRDFHLSPLPPDKLFRKDYRTYLNRARDLRALGPSGFAKLVFTRSPT